MTVLVIAISAVSLLVGLAALLLIAFAVRAGQEVSVEVRAIRARRQVDQVVDAAQRRLSEQLDGFEADGS